MITSIELQVISKILTSKDEQEVAELLTYDDSYYSVFKEHIDFIFDHKEKYGNVPDVFTFQAQFPDITLVPVNESLQFLKSELTRNKQHILLVSTFNKIKDLGAGDVTEAWEYIQAQSEYALQLDTTAPMDLVKDAKKRSDQVLAFSKQTRIPTGFKEIDKLMYGGLSTVEELVLILARTGVGKSWCCTKMMESAQANGFPVLYYSPEMQASYLGTRFDTWRGHFLNSQLYQGKYNEEYLEYIENLQKEETPAFVVEDKDVPSGSVNIPFVETFVRKHKIKLCIIDGLSYMEDTKRADTDYTKYKNLCLGLFKISKRYGCAMVVAMQANRDTRNSKDDKGEEFASLYNAEGSDHPGRICTQAFIIRQIFDKHVIDIKLEKTRMANNQKPVLSYSWDANSGRMQYIPGDDGGLSDALQPSVDASSVLGNQTNAVQVDANAFNESSEDIDWGEDVEF